MRAPHGARLHATLTAVAEGSVTRGMLAACTGWKPDVAGKALENARHFGLLEFRGNKLEGERAHQLTSRGTRKLGAFNLLQPDHKPDPAAQALELLADTPAGMDSQVLAAELGMKAHEVEALLKPHVDAKRLIVCAVTKVIDGKANGFFHYRESSSPGPRRDFSLRPNDPGFMKPQPMATAPALAVAASAVPDADDDGGEDGAQVEAHLAGDDTDALPTVQTLPVVGELDINQVHRRAAELAGEPDPADAFNAALWSSGYLVIRSRGQEIRLQPDHAAALVEYVVAVSGVDIPRRGGAAS